MVENIWREIKAAKMSGREGSPKISLSLLKGRSTNQSVPVITYRFNPTAQNITEISDTEEEDETAPSGTPPGLDNPTGRGEGGRDPSPTKNILLGKRSSSLDSCDPPQPPTPPKTEGGGGGGGLLSRLTKTFEDKINEIRKDKGERERVYVGESSEGESGSVTGVILSDKSPVQPKEEEITPQSLSNSPPKGKSLVQDFSAHTNKIKSELGNIRPKFSELRQRRASKERSKEKSKPSVFTSLLGRDEGMGEQMLVESSELEVDKAEEATESNITPDATGPRPIPAGQPQMAATTPKHSNPIRSNVTEILNQMPVTPSFLYKFLVAVFVVGFILPLPEFIGGLLVGVLLSALVMHCLLLLLHPAAPSQPQNIDDGPFLLKLPVYEDKQLYKGWMNKLEGEYSPDTYHVSLTHTVLLRLQGSRLKMDFPRGKVPKHARQNEELRHVAFTHHVEYDLSGSQVTLLPKNLPRRWLWSRKYPICIKLGCGPCSPSHSPSPVSIDSTPSNGSPIRHPSTCPPSPSPPEDSHTGGLEGHWSLEDDLLTSSLDMTTFEEVTRDMCQEKILVLFARCDRDKDDWFRRLVAASELPPTHPPRSTPNPTPLLDGGESVIMEGMAEDTPPSLTPPELSFEKYMARLLYRPPPPPSSSSSSSSSPPPPPSMDPSAVTWINAFAGRIFYDLLRNPIWANKVQERVQRKLSKLHLPSFVGELVVCGVSLGRSAPQLLWAGPPHQDSRGLWLDVGLEYSGSFTLELETKLDLMKLKRSAGDSENTPSPPPPRGHPHSHPPSPGEGPSARGSGHGQSERLPRELHFDADTDDSVESSSEEEEEEDGGVEASLGPGGGGSRRFLRLVDTVAASRCFQHAAEWRVLQRALQGVSNTRITLGVEVRRLAGTLAINLPPPPADRLWYGFRGSPELSMAARPGLGERPLSHPLLLEFIERQLRQVFLKVFVLPNMDDLVIPVMSPLLPGQTHPPRPPWEHTHTHAHAHDTILSTQTVTPTVKYMSSPH